MIYLFTLLTLFSYSQCNNIDDKTDQQIKNKINNSIICLFISIEVIASFTILLGLFYFSFDKNDTIYQQNNENNGNIESFYKLSRCLTIVSR